MNLTNIQRRIQKAEKLLDIVSRVNTFTNFDREGRDAWLLLSDNTQANVKPGKNYSTPPGIHICKIRYHGSKRWRTLI